MVGLDTRIYDSDISVYGVCPIACSTRTRAPISIFSIFTRGQYLSEILVDIYRSILHNILDVRVCFKSLDHLLKFRSGSCRRSFGWSGALSSESLRRGPLSRSLTAYNYGSYATKICHINVRTGLGIDLGRQGICLLL
jgi:hypothetical protein